MTEIAILVALVVGLTEVVKRIGVADRWLPLAAIVFGIFLNVFGNMMGGTLPEFVMGGIMVGLMASGLWEVSKHTVLGK